MRTIAPNYDDLAELLCWIRQITQAVVLFERQYGHFGSIDLEFSRTSTSMFCVDLKGVKDDPAASVVRNTNFTVMGRFPNELNLEKLGSILAEGVGGILVQNWVLMQKRPTCYELYPII